MAAGSHPYLAGNFRPVAEEYDLTACAFTGHIPAELLGGQYIRNGSNPQQQHHFNDRGEKDAKDGPYHWFDGDGKLAGVLFDQTPAGEVVPKFVSKFMLTDVHLSGRALDSPIVPSISDLLLARSIFSSLFAIFRSDFLCVLAGVARLSVANTNVVFHDGRALALCESGKAWEVRLPGLESVGWWAFEGAVEDRGKRSRGIGSKSSMLGRFFHEWTTAHPRTDPLTGDLVLFGSTFYPPYVNYSVISPEGEFKCLQVPIPGVNSPRMMHDFSASLTHTCILDLPLSLSPLNLLRMQPVIRFERDQPSRFGIFPRLYDGLPESGAVRWFEDPEACCIFHTANSWDSPATPDASPAFNLLACRFRTASLVSLAGGLTPLLEEANPTDACLLTYYRFDLPSNAPAHNIISHRFPLLAIPFEFPVMPPSLGMHDAHWLYGCSMVHGGFDARLGGGAKIDCLVKVDVRALVQEGARRGATGDWRGEVVDGRNMAEILADQEEGREQIFAVRVFRFPRGWYGQEPAFVPREGWRRELVDPDEERVAREVLPGREDDGWLVCYAFDEGLWLNEKTGDVKEGAYSELWIIDASLIGCDGVLSSSTDFPSSLIARVRLPSRVPYGLHGQFFTAEQIASQRPDIPVIVAPPHPCVASISTTMPVPISSTVCSLSVPSTDDILYLLAPPEIEDTVLKLDASSRRFTRELYFEKGVWVSFGLMWVAVVWQWFLKSFTASKEEGGASW